MTDDAGILSAAWMALRRQWWIVLLAVVVAVAIAYFASGEQPDAYVGKATITLDLNLPRYPKMATIDELVQFTASEQVRSAVATATGLTPAEVASSLRATGIGNPQSSIDITFEHPDAAIAEKGAATAAEAVHTNANSRAEPLIETTQDQIRLSEDLLAQMKAQKQGMSPWEQTDIDVRIYGVERDLLASKAQLRVYDAWGYSGEATSSLKLGGGARTRNAIGGALAGLVLGLLVAAAREAFMRKGAKTT